MAVSEIETNTAREHFFIMKLFPKSKRSTNVTETLLLHFLDCRQVFKEQIQSFIHYKKELVVFVLKTESVVFKRGSNKGLICTHRSSLM